MNVTIFRGDVASQAGNSDKIIQRINELAQQDGSAGEAIVLTGSYATLAAEASYDARIHIAEVEVPSTAAAEPQTYTCFYPSDASQLDAEEAGVLRAVPAEIMEACSVHTHLKDEDKRKLISNQAVMPEGAEGEIHDALSRSPSGTCELRGIFEIDTEGKEVTATNPKSGQGGLRFKYTAVKGGDYTFDAEASPAAGAPAAAAAATPPAAGSRRATASSAHDLCVEAHNIYTAQREGGTQGGSNKFSVFVTADGRAQEFAKLDQSPAAATSGQESDSEQPLVPKRDNIYFYYNQRLHGGSSEFIPHPLETTPVFASKVTNGLMDSSGLALVAALGAAAIKGPDAFLSTFLKYFVPMITAEATSLSFDKISKYVVRTVTYQDLYMRCRNRLTTSPQWLANAYQSIRQGVFSSLSGSAAAAIMASQGYLGLPSRDAMPVVSAFRGPAAKMVGIDDARDYEQWTKSLMKKVASAFPEATDVKITYNADGTRAPVFELYNVRGEKLESETGILRSLIADSSDSAGKAKQKELADFCKKAPKLNKPSSSIAVSQYTQIFMRNILGFVTMNYRDNAALVESLLCIPSDLKDSLSKKAEDFMAAVKSNNRRAAFIGGVFLMALIASSGESVQPDNNPTNGTTSTTTPIPTTTGGATTYTPTTTSAPVPLPAHSNEAAKFVAHFLNPAAAKFGFGQMPLPKNGNMTEKALGNYFDATIAPFVMSLTCTGDKLANDLKAKAAAAFAPTGNPDGADNIHWTGGVEDVSEVFSSLVEAGGNPDCSKAAQAAEAKGKAEGQLTGVATGLEGAPWVAEAQGYTSVEIKLDEGLVAYLKTQNATVSAQNSEGRSVLGETAVSQTIEIETPEVEDNPSQLTFYFGGSTVDVDLTINYSQGEKTKLTQEALLGPKQPGRFLGRRLFSTETVQHGRYPLRDRLLSNAANVMKKYNLAGCKKAELIGRISDIKETLTDSNLNSSKAAGELKRLESTVEYFGEDAVLKSVQAQSNTTEGLARHGNLRGGYTS